MWDKGEKGGISVNEEELVVDFVKDGEREGVRLTEEEGGGRDGEYTERGGGVVLMWSFFVEGGWGGGD